MDLKREIARLRAEIWKERTLEQQQDGTGFVCLDYVKMNKIEELQEELHMDFETFKKQVFRIARLARLSHMIPNSDTLYRLWEQRMSPPDVVTLHCTETAQKERFNESAENV